MGLLRLALLLGGAAILLVACQSTRVAGVYPHEPIPASWQPHPENPGSFDVAPKLVRSEAPVYPITQLLQHKTGTATIAFTIDEHGKTGDFKVIDATYPYFASHAILAVQRWQFEPATKHGSAVAVRERVAFDYGFQ